MCRPCREFCRGNSDVCLTKEELKVALVDPNDRPLDPDGVSLFSLFPFLKFFLSPPFFLDVALTL